MGQLALANIINVSVAVQGTGAGAYNTSNLAIFTHSVPAGSFGSLGYQIYLSPTQVGIDFGTSSQVYAMANAIFSQQPNILANGGYLVVVLMLNSTSAVVAQQTLTLSGTPTTGTYQLGYNGNYTTDLAYNASNTTVQTALQLLAGLSSATVAGSYTAGFTVTFTGVSGPAYLLTVQHDKMQDTNGYDVFITAATTVIGVAGGTVETFDASITRTTGLIQYFGCMCDSVQLQSVMLAAAAVIQALNKIAFFVSSTAADVSLGGMLDLLRSGGYTQSRGLYFNDGTAADTLNMMAAYAGRALSTNFLGSNTTQDMHMKNLATIQPDSTMTQSLYNLCQAAGVDVYASFEGVTKVACSGANGFFDQIYNQQWFVGAVKTAYFNVLAQTSTKIPQTEQGMTTIKDQIITVCEQSVTNSYLAPGKWTSPNTFGNLSNFYSNIADRGYYIYSQPVSQQLAADRAARKAPLIQIALKEAGSIETGNVIVNINA